MTLTEFLLARIAVDELLATPGDPYPTPMGMWSPERVLTECEAKRRIVAEHRFTDQGFPHSDIFHCCSTCAQEDTSGGLDGEWPCPTLKWLALPFADHPDYREEWKP